MIYRLALAAAVALSVARPAAAIANDKFFDGSLLSEDVCYSSSGNARLSTLSVQLAPASREILYTLPNSPKIVISCLHVVETTLSGSESQCVRPGGDTSQMYLCNAPENSQTFTCEKLSEYLYVSRRTIARGSVNEADRQWRLEWSSGGQSAECFPRLVEFVAVIESEFEITGNVWVLAIMGVLLALVVVCVAVFACYQFKTYTERAVRFEQQVKDPANAMSPGFGTQPQVPMQEGGQAGQQMQPDEEAGLGPQPLPIAEVRQLYMSSLHGQDQFIDVEGGVARKYVAHDATQEHIAHGEQQRALAALRDGGGAGSPSLYQRSFLTPLDTGAVDTSVSVWSPRDRDVRAADVTVVPMDTLERTRRSPRRFDPLHRGIVACGDCELPVQGATTPQFCAVSGKRHF